MARAGPKEGERRSDQPSFSGAERGPTIASLFDLPGCEKDALQFSVPDEFATAEELDLVFNDVDLGSTEAPRAPGICLHFFDLIYVYFFWYFLKIIVPWLQMRTFLYALGSDSK
jgi:hypothetical protein